MFPTSLAISSTMPRETQRPLRRVAGSFAAAVTVLALMAASALPARAERPQATVAGAPVVAVAFRALAPSADQTRTLPAPLTELQVRSPRVPAACAIEVAGARRAMTVYPERCLRRAGFDFRLPRHCAYTARILGRTDRVYGADCLRNAGYRVDAGRGHGRGFRDHGRGPGRDYGHGRPRHAY